MKQQLLIIGGAVIVLILVIVWAYLMFFGTPKSPEDVFSELGLSGEEDTSFVPAPEVAPEEGVLVNMERDRLRQLTTREVAGFIEPARSTSTDPIYLYYVEIGTGYIYSIDLVSGEEERISGTTVAQTNEAQFSPNGRFVAMSKNSNAKNFPLVLGRLGTSTEMEMTSFSETVHDFHIGNNSELLYTVVEGQGLQAYSYNFASGVSKSLFTIPFTEAKIIWGDSSDSIHYTYPKPSLSLEGSLYKIEGSTFSRMPISGFGLTANTNGTIFISTKSTANLTAGNIYNERTGEIADLDSAIIADKCTFTNGEDFICAQEPTIAARDFADNWYKGISNFKDSLWSISGSNMSAELIVDTFQESGRELDLVNLSLGFANYAIYFTNKNDNSLWMYELQK